MNHQEAMDFLYSRVNYETFVRIPYLELGKNLERLERFLVHCGSPHLRYPVIHVAGTKGKGSTCSLIDAIFSSAGYCVGRFTSPHLNSVHERFTIGGVPCSREEFTEIVSWIKQRLDAPLWKDKELQEDNESFTFFELTTVFALEYFTRRNVDIAVLEVGLGGRFDATNICRPTVTVITNIHLEHTELLGDTLPLIAAEKAGIIKETIPVISGVLQPGARDVIRQTALSRHAPVIEAGTDFHVISHADQTFDYVSGPTRWDSLQLGMLGKHQQDNAALALTTARIFMQNGWKITEDAIRHALQTTTLSARIEKLRDFPTVIIDGAHNPASAEALVATLKECFSHHKWWLLFGVNQDKDVAGILAILLPHFEEVVFSEAKSTKRAVPAAELSKLAAEKKLAAELPNFSSRVKAIPDAEAALHEVLSRAEPTDLICATGSLYFAAEIQEILRRHPAL